MIEGIEGYRVDSFEFESIIIDFSNLCMCICILVLYVYQKQKAIIMLFCRDFEQMPNCPAYVLRSSVRV